MQCDILIVGAGPAGSSLAHRLASSGFDVILADRKDFPRHKPCGEFLSPECAPLLAELGLESELAELGPRLVRGMCLHGGGARALGRFRRIGSRGEHALRGFGIRRDRFDDMLRRAAVANGTRWLPRRALDDVERDRSGRITGATLRGPDGRTELCTARWVVGADGVHSAVAQRMGVRRRIPWLDQVALVTHFDGVEPEPFAEVHLFDGGFFAATTVDDSLFSLNLIVPRRSLRDRTTSGWDSFVAEHLERAPGLADRLESARRIAPWRGVGSLACTTTAQTFEGAALVGDACGYVDPLTGEGIYFALFGARALASALVQAMHDPKRERAALAEYALARRREIAPRMRASLWLQRALRHPWLMRAFLRRAERWPGLADFLVTLSGDTVHPRDLLSLSFWRDFRRSEVACS